MLLGLVLKSQAQRAQLQSVIWDYKSVTLFLVEVDAKAIEILSLCYSILKPLLWDWVPHKELLLCLSLCSSTM